MDTMRDALIVSAVRTPVGRAGGALADVVRVPWADVMLVPLPSGVDPIAAAGVPDNVSDGFRCVAGPLADAPGAEVLVVGGLASSVGLYAAMSALAHATEWFRTAAARDRQSVEAGARRFSLTLGRTIELALLVPVPIAVGSVRTVTGASCWATSDCSAVSVDTRSVPVPAMVTAPEASTVSAVGMSLPDPAR